MVGKVFSASQLFIGLSVLTNFPFFIFSSYYIAFLKFNGLNYAEMAIVFAVSSLTIGVLDFPTGNFADRYGRKKSIVLAIAFAGVGMIVYGAAKEILTFALGEFFIGVGAALMSGSLEAWFYDEARAVPGVQNAQDVQSTFGAGMGLMNLTAIFAGFIASFLASKSVSLPFFVSGGLLILTALFALVFLNENYGERDIPYTVFLKESLSIVSRSDQLKMAGYRHSSLQCFLSFLLVYLPTIPS
ncbi:MAG: MFS transporter [Archaeoglobus sp.]|nr:MFS transporter [Archaeoglobus sp.]